jgi:DNA-binding transcriptional LysR family regulator
MDLHQIECVVAISEYGTFTRAAESLYITQSSLSYAVGGLERELGVPLFARLGRRVVLTAAGEAFLPSARESLLAARSAREAASAVGGLMTGQVGVCVSPTLKRFAAAAIAEFCRQHPDVRVSLSVASPKEALELVRAAALPLAIVGLYDVPDQLKVCELFDEEVVVVFPPATQVKTSVKVEDLERFRLVVSRESRTPHSKAQQHLLSRAVDIAAETDDVEATLELVLAGLGAAVMSVDGAAGAVERGAVTAPLEPPVSYKAGLVYREGRLTPAERAFRACVIEQAATLDAAASDSAPGVSHRVAGAGSLRCSVTTRSVG